ncbi:copper resistance protein NlpE [Myroides sp. LJL119]
MKNKSILAVALLCGALAFTSCKKQADTKVEQTVVEQQTFTGQDGHTTENSVDWDGTYKGVLPCADCPGIEVTIVLNPDGTFQREDVYQDKKDGTFKQVGTFTWDKDGRIVTLKSKDEVSQFQVREGSMVMLDTQGNIITGELADNYVLTKQ